MSWLISENVSGETQYDSPGGCGVCATNPDSGSSGALFEYGSVKEGRE